MDDTQRRIVAAPLLRAHELRRRSNLITQLVRFLSLNWTMYRLARHHH